MAFLPAVQNGSNTDSLKITGVDVTDSFHCGRAIILDLDGSYAVSRIWKSAVSGSDTLVYIETTEVTSDLLQVGLGVGARSEQQLPNHCHSKIEGDGGQSESRMIMAYKDADEIYIGPGAYMLYSSDGAIDRVMYNDETLTFQFGSGGSNSGSSAIPTSGKLYLYLDESVCKAQRSRKLTAGCFIAVTTAPGALSETKKQRLNGSDRCIWAVPTNSSAEIIPFFQAGNRVDIFSNTNDIASTYALGTSPVEFSTMAPIVANIIRMRAKLDSGAYLRSYMPGTSNMRDESWMEDTFDERTYEIPINSDAEVKLAAHTTKSLNAGSFGYYFGEGL